LTSFSLCARSVQFVNEFAPLSSVSRANRKERGSRKEDVGALDVPPGPAFEPTYIYKMLNNIRSDTFKVDNCYTASTLEI
jgi:hypothetical protein